MPPKAPSRNSNMRSQKQAEQFIPIYDILADKDEEDAVRSLAKKIDALAKSDDKAAEKNFIVFVLKAVGLDSFVQKINWREPMQSLTDLLQQASEQNQKPILANEFYLINLKSKFHKQFSKRVKNFLQIVISDEISLIENTDTLKNLYALLSIVTKCKMRNIRHSSIVVCGIVTKCLKNYYDELIKEKSLKKAAKIVGNIDEKYLQEIIQPRLKDIDSQIREKSFDILSDTLIIFSEQLLTTNRLHKLYTLAMAENKPKIVEHCLKSISKFFQLDKQKLSPTVNRNLSAFAAELIKPLEQIILLPNRNSCHAMDLLLAIHTFNPSLAALKPKIIAKVFQIHGYEKFQQGLKKAVNIFFRSLINFSQKQQIIEHRSMLLVQITHLLCSINSSNLLSTILNEFFSTHTALFTFDEMFLLLLTEYYHQDGSQIQLQSKELNVICTMICEFNIYLQKHRNISNIKQLEESYNRLLLTNCKEIFYEKIPNHTALCSLYLRLFSLLFQPIDTNLGHYLGFVEEKVLNLIREQKFVTIANGNYGTMQQIVTESVAICFAIWRDHSKHQIIQKHFQVQKLVHKDKIDEIDIIKISALVTKFPIEMLLSSSVLRKMVSGFTGSLDKTLKLSIISYCFHSHRNIFASFFHSPTALKHQNYIATRNTLLQFLLHNILASSSQQPIIKLAAFNTLCRALRLICNIKISDLPAVYYQVSSTQLDILYDYVGSYVQFQEEQVSQMSMMMAGLSIQSQEVKQQIFANLFLVYSQCLKFAMQKQSLIFITRSILMNAGSHLYNSMDHHLDSFISNLIKLQLSTENTGKLIFWRLYNQLINEIPVQDEEVLERVVMKFVNSYYNFRKGQPRIKSQLSNKLILYAADTIDKTLNSQTFQRFIALKFLLQKVYRRFSKEVLQRLHIFYTSKSSRIQDKQVEDMREFLGKISKVSGPKTKKKTKKQEEDSSDQKDSESQSDQEEDKQQRSVNQIKKEEDIMVEKSPVHMKTRESRSKTKRKTK